jgi:hypothetical protein
LAEIFSGRSVPAFTFLFVGAPKRAACYVGGSATVAP